MFLGSEGPGTMAIIAQNSRFPRCMKGMSADLCVWAGAMLGFRLTWATPGLLPGYTLWQGVAFSKAAWATGVPSTSLMSTDNASACPCVS